MRDRLLKLLTVLSVGAAIISFAIWSTGAVVKQQGNQKRKTLREIGAERDIKTNIAPSGMDNEYDDLATLTNAAEAIVVAKVDNQKSDFDGDDHISTYYNVQVESILKDVELKAPVRPGKPEPAPLQTPLKFVRSGGSVEVNGHHVRQYLRGEERLGAGQHYVLFLWWSPSYNCYYLVGGTSGAFLVRAKSNDIVPLGSASGLLKYEGASLGSFVNEVSASR
jgi:hypothetical protein